jgi:prepilin-type N-terminal cleavage/methylation domain-containing protein
MTIDRRHLRSGFTLAEATMALVILGIAAAGVLLPFARGAAVQAEGTHRTLAANLANNLLEQVVGTPFDQIVATWDGYAEPQGQVTDADGNVFTDPIYAGFSREVVCEECWPWPQQPPAANFLLQVTVQVYHRGRPITTLARLVGR